MALNGINVLGFTLPSKPMSPLIHSEIPGGPEWGHQLKWDGIRTLAAIANGNVSLISKNMLPLNNAFPEIERLLLQKREQARLLLDGEVVMYDTRLQRPVFQRVLQRVRSKRIVSTEAAHPELHLIYVLFDLLAEGDTDWTEQPYSARHARLCSLFPEKTPQLFVTDLVPAGELLWAWVESNGWEGVVSKRLSSTYHEGKKHQDWWKKKTLVRLNVSIIALTIREGQVASLVMAQDGIYIGRVSLGLTYADKQTLLAYGKQHLANHAALSPLPADLRKERLLWLSRPFHCEVTGLELTSGGLLRHPKLVRLSIN